MTTLSLRLINDHPHLICKDGSRAETIAMQPDPRKPLVCSFLRWLLITHEEKVTR